MFPRRSLSCPDLEVSQVSSESVRCELSREDIGKKHRFIRSTWGSHLPGSNCTYKYHFLVSGNCQANITVPKNIVPEPTVKRLNEPPTFVTKIKCRFPRHGSKNLQKLSQPT